MFNRPITPGKALGSAPLTASQLSSGDLQEILSGLWPWNPAFGGEKAGVLLRVEVELVARSLGLSTE